MAEIYTGRAENVRTNRRGVEFDVVVDDGQGKEVFRRTQWISTGVLTSVEAVDAVKNVVERFTQEMWAHIEGGKEAINGKASLEAYRATCDHFVPRNARPNPTTGRGVEIQ